MSDINIPIEAGKSILLETAGKLCDKNIVVTALGGTGTAPTAFTVASVDELPANAPDGSMAIVYADEVINGTWVFNEVISVPNATWKVFIDVGDITYHEICADGVRIRYGNDITAYDVNSGWQDETLKTVGVRNSGDAYNSEFIAWLKENAVKVADEVVGCWRFNDVVDFEERDYYFTFISYYSVLGRTIHNNIYDEGGVMVYEGDYCYAVVYDGTWIDAKYRTIYLPSTVRDAECVDWLRSNATKVIPDKFYIRENGEWVYEREIF